MKPLHLLKCSIAFVLFLFVQDGYAQVKIGGSAKEPLTHRRYSNLKAMIKANTVEIRFENNDMHQIL